MIIEKSEDALRLIAEEDFTVNHANALQQQLLSGLADANGKAVVLDLSHSEWMDSSGIKLLIGLYKTCEGNRQPFHVEVGSQNVLRTLNLCKLNQMVDIRLVGAASEEENSTENAEVAAHE